MLGSSDLTCCCLCFSPGIDGLVVGALGFRRSVVCRGYQNDFTDIVITAVTTVAYIEHVCLLLSVRSRPIFKLPIGFHGK